ncbi:hypothetical protein AYY19_13770 [Photobacterium aquimaris]|uniref:hypothetical protein n=1 Tax=Photobacterium aquimaris TaxID=512643 RepID=UPI0007F026FA|nr:hypothetical protein [Photobacterium aquimaris]OBU17310.1 hypothetical protein AYY19_13770 [Photobacterium aquimaris]
MINQESKNKMNKKLPLLLVSILAVGCGGGGDDETPSIDKPSIENPTPPTTPCIDGSCLEDDSFTNPNLPEPEKPSPEDNVGGSFEEPRPLNTVGGNNITTAGAGNNFYYVDLSKGDEIHLYLDLNYSNTKENSNNKYNEYETKNITLYHGDAEEINYESLIKETYSSTLVYKSEKNQRIKISAAFEGNLYASIDHLDKSKNKGILGSPANPIKITQKEIDEGKVFKISLHLLETYYEIDAKKGAKYTFKTPIVFKHIENNIDEAMYHALQRCNNSSSSEEYGDMYYVGLSTDGGYTYNCEFREERGLKNGEFNLKYELNDYYYGDTISTTFKIIEEIVPDVISPDISNTGQQANNNGGTVEAPTKISIKGNNIIEFGEDGNYFYADALAGDKIYLHAVLDTAYGDDWVNTDCSVNGKAGITISNAKDNSNESSCTNTLIYDVTETGTYIVNTGFNGAVSGNLYADIVRDGDPSTIGALGRPSNPIQVEVDKYYPLARNELNNYYQIETVANRRIPIEHYLFEVGNQAKTYYKERAYGVSWDGGLTYSLSGMGILMYEAGNHKFNMNFAKGDGTNFTGHFIVSEPYEPVAAEAK